MDHSINKITVLVTGSGAPGISGTLYSLRNNPDQQAFNIVTTDIQANPVGKYLSDAFYQLPAPEADNYMDELHKAVQKSHVQVILPQTTREINILSQKKDLLKEWGVVLALSDFSAIERANDKYLILKECEKNGIPVPEHHLVSNIEDLKQAITNLGYPEKKVVVKPRLSNGQRGVKVLTPEALTLDAYLKEKPSSLAIDLPSFLEIFEGQDSFPDLIVSEYMPGIEYTVDMFRHGSINTVVPRTRDVIRSGISFQTTVDLSRKDIINYSEKLANSMGLQYCFGFQFKLDDNGVPKILESNPRVQGTMVASTMAGYNMIYYTVMAALGKLDGIDAMVIDKTCFKRLWGGVGITENGHELGRL